MYYKERENYTASGTVGGKKSFAGIVATVIITMAVLFFIFLMVKNMKSVKNIKF